MKKSRFNIFVNYNDSILAFNSKTLALLEFDKDFFERFNCYNLTNEEKEILLKMGFLINYDNENEKCINCNILPMCMGGCTLKRINNKESCIPEKYNLENYVKLLYEEAVL